MSWVFRVVGLALLVGVSLPLLNVLVDAPIPIHPEQLRGKTPAFAKASPVFQSSCLPCHSSTPQRPWYARLPVATQLIEADIATALACFNMEERLYTPELAPDSLTLANLDFVLQTGHMPPLRYTALHWRAWLTEDKKSAIRTWIAEERAKAANTQLSDN